MDKTNCTIDDCKLFINHDGKCKTEYDFWINKEKLREKFKKEVIKVAIIAEILKQISSANAIEKLIYYLDNEFIELLKDDISDVIKINISNWKLKLIMKLQEKIQNGDFE
ncbi:hypothetical protein [Spiroplasma endosymbiont of Tricholauxania praeusta]|uniref:hypothetical protein n=1 Tax=Spiroplasma endosymbiont of Tricholauxania praeusta TaxID=3066296 RepID=UPI0030CEE22B